MRDFFLFPPLVTHREAQQERDNRCVTTKKIVAHGRCFYFCKFVVYEQKNAFGGVSLSTTFRNNTETSKIFLICRFCICNACLITRMHYDAQHFLSHVQTRETNTNARTRMQWNCRMLMNGSSEQQLCFHILLLQMCPHTTSGIAGR